MLWFSRSSDGERVHGRARVQRAASSSGPSSSVRPTPGGAAQVAIAMLVGAGVCACAGHAPAVPTVPIASSSPSGLTLIWQNHELRPVGQPIAVGSVAVGVVSRDRHAFIVGIDPATGRARWQQPLANSWLAVGDEVRFASLGDDKVAYLRPARAHVDDAVLVVADVHTGKDLAASPPALFTSPPIACANGKDACAIIYTGRQPGNPAPDGVPAGATRSNPPGTQLQFRLEVATGDALQEVKLPKWTRFLDSTGLFDLGDRPGDSLGLLRDGATLWLNLGNGAFPADFSTDHGWEWQLFRDAHVFVGTQYGKRTEVDGDPALDLASGTAMAGISERTGQVLWRDRGSGFHCHLGSHRVPVRCRASGLLVFDDGRGTARDFAVTVEGFDVATGRTTWSVPMGAAKGLQPFERPAIAGPREVVLDGPAGPTVLDYTTGHVAPAAPGATFWCMTPVMVELWPVVLRTRSSWIGTRHQWIHERVGADLAWVCDAAGKPASALPSIAATMAVGARVGDRAVIATVDGYLGFRAPSP